MSREAFRALCPNEFHVKKLLTDSEHSISECQNMLSKCMFWAVKPFNLIIVFLIFPWICSFFRIFVSFLL